jgi:hypothetical protein
MTKTRPSGKSWRSVGRELNPIISEPKTANEGIPFSIRSADGAGICLAVISQPNIKQMATNTHESQQVVRAEADRLEDGGRKRVMEGRQYRPLPERS